MEHRHPQTYLDALRAGAEPIRAADTSATAFVGPARRGSPGELVRLQGWDDYLRVFGPVADEDDAMALAVQCYFRNGGRDARVARIAAAAAAAPEAGDASPPGVADYAAFFERTLAAVDDIGIVVLPGVVAQPGHGLDVVRAAQAHCADERVRNRMLIVDLPEDADLAGLDDAETFGLARSSYTAIYHPWLELANPLHDPSRRPGSPPTCRVPPSASVAGVWARTDAQRGVWRPPAGLDATLAGALRPTRDLGDDERESLDSAGVNALLTRAGAGTVVWGSRSFAARGDGPLRYVPVRRTVTMVEHSIRRAIRWAVFEPNDRLLWAALRASVENFLVGLWRDGAFQGRTAAEAFVVRCGFGQTMTQADVDAGRVVVEFGLAMLKPAEFLFVRVEQASAG